MSASSPKAVMMSATLHGVVIGLILVFTYLFQQKTEPQKVFELVAGEGDNYLATEAPALGSPSAVTVDLPQIPEPRPAPPDPVPTPPPAPTPVVPAPPPPKKETVTPTPTPKPPDPNKVDPNKDMAKAMRWEIIKAESRAKMEIARRRAAEKKKLEEEKKKQAEEQKKQAEEQRRLTKEEFDLNASKKAAPPAKTTPVKVAKIDAEGIAKGVSGGSTANKQSGASGKSLVASDGRAIELYFEMLKQKVRAELLGLAGMEDHLSVTVAVHISASGALSRARVKTSSGNAEFDRAVIAAFDRVRMPDHPEKKAEELEMIFRTKEIEQR